MIEMVLGSGFGALAVAGLVCYGRLQEQVTSQDDKFDALRKDIARLDDRIVDLTDFLLREHRGEDSNQIRR